MLSEGFSRLPRGRRYDLVCANILARPLRRLSRDLAARNHYPAIDILQSVSRTMPDVVGPSHREKAGQVRAWMAAIRDTDDLVSVGAYVPGANPRVDEARARGAAIDTFLCQPSDTLFGMADATAALEAL